MPSTVVLPVKGFSSATLGTPGFFVPVQKTGRRRFQRFFTRFPNPV